MEILIWILLPVFLLMGLIYFVLGIRGGRPDHLKDELLHADQGEFDQSLYPSLVALDQSAARLWETGNHVDFILFVEQLRKTEETVARHKRVLELKDHLDLQVLFLDFWKFEYGNQRLMELRERKIRMSDVFDQWPVESFIEQASETRKRYSQKVSEIEAKFHQVVMV